MPIMPSAQGPTSLQDLHEQIAGSNRRNRALVLSAKDPFTKLNLLQVCIVAGHQSIALHGA